MITLFFEKQITQLEVRSQDIQIVLFYILLEQFTSVLDSSLLWMQVEKNFSCKIRTRANETNLVLNQFLNKTKII